MDTNAYPCIIYQRQRPSAPEASHFAWQTAAPQADELVAQEGYTVRGLCGDSEFAPPFCGGSEIRPGYEAAWRHARKIAAEHGACTIIIGNASPIGDGDPFMPAYEPADTIGRVYVRLVNFHLHSQALYTSLRSACSTSKNIESRDEAACGAGAGPRRC